MTTIVGNDLGNSLVLIKTLLAQHTLTSAELSGAVSIPLTFAHGLGFKPIVEGSFINTSDNAVRQLPYVWRNSGTYYGGGAQVTQSATVYIDSVDNTNINCRAYYFDIFGLSWLAANTNLNFKFYLLQERLIQSANG